MDEKRFEKLCEKYGITGEDDTNKFRNLLWDTDSYTSISSRRNYEKDNYLYLLSSILHPSVETMQLFDSFNNVFELDNASGEQLDLIGSLIGLSRLLNYVPSSGDRVMDDDEYKLALKLQIAQNTWDGSLGSLKGIYEQILGDSMTIVYIDNQNMTVTIDVYGDVQTRQTEMLDRSGLILVPVGVGKEIHIIGGSADLEINVGVGITAIECVTTATFL